jgi:hypothetical protein
MSAVQPKTASDNLRKSQAVYDKDHLIQNVLEASGEFQKLESLLGAEIRNHFQRSLWMRLENRVNWTQK